MQKHSDGTFITQMLQQILTILKLKGANMYKLQATPDATATLDNGQILTPILTLKDEWGGVSHIVRDDSCFVLVNRTDQLNNIFSMSCYWYSEAVDALVNLIGVGINNVRRKEIAITGLCTRMPDDAPIPPIAKYYAEWEE